MLESERQQLNELQRELMVLRKDIEEAEENFTGRFKALKQNAWALFTDIDKKMNGE